MRVSPPWLHTVLRHAAAPLLAAVLLVTGVLAPLLLLMPALALVVWLAASRAGHQALAITATGLATLPQRLGATAVVVVGIAGVVGVLVALLAMAEGLQFALRQAGSDDTAIVLRAGADAELSSGLERSATTLVARAPGIARDAQGRPIASAEVVVIANVPKRSTGTDANVEVRGVGSEVWALRPQTRIIAGRAFRAGLRELLVGRGALAQFRGLEPGRTVRLNNQAWRVVGVFASGDAHESELWGDAESVAAAYRREGFQSVSVRLAGAADFERFRAALLGDPRLRVDVQTTRDYYSKQSERLASTIRALGTGVAVIMAIGAVFGALNTMYAAVAARAREIATLRALGFTAAPVVVAVLLETMLLAVIGGGARRRRRLRGVQWLSRLHAGRQLQPGGVPIPGWTGVVAARPAVGTRHRFRRWAVPGVAGRRPAGHGGAARALTRPKPATVGARRAPRPAEPGSRGRAMLWGGEEGGSVVRHCAGTLSDARRPTGRFRFPGRARRPARDPGEMRAGRTAADATPFSNTAAARMRRGPCERATMTNATSLHWSSACKSHVGMVRKLNEDACVELAGHRLWAVADGMGGHAAGEVASRMVVEALAKVPSPTSLGAFVGDVHRALQAVNLQLSEEAGRRREQLIGSTVVALLAFEQYCVTLWAGDSRAYLLRDGTLSQITRDHSQVEDMIARGILTRRQAEGHPASNVITRAVGVMPDLVLDTEMVTVADGDVFLLCSDGLYNEVSAKEIAELLASGDCRMACELLVDRALRHGARDNVTAVVVRASDQAHFTKTRLNPTTAGARKLPDESDDPTKLS